MQSATTFCSNNSVYRPPAQLLQIANASWSEYFPVGHCLQSAAASLHKTLTEAGITATSNIVLVKSRFQPQTKVERWLETFKKAYINMWLNELTHESTSFNITLAVFTLSISYRSFFDSCALLYFAV